MFKITAVCNHQGSSKNGLREMLWFGTTKKQAEKWLVKLQNENSKYSEWKIEKVEVKS